MTRLDPKNPLMWYLVQVAEYLLIVAVLGRIIPASTPRWLQVAVFVLVVVSVFVLNYYIVMPRIGRSSRTGSNDDDL
jgi:predicted membrane channel-forming protein YqfA (hemolysin III family)